MYFSRVVSIDGCVLVGKRSNTSIVYRQSAKAAKPWRNASCAVLNAYRVCCNLNLVNPVSTIQMPAIDTYLHGSRFTLRWIFTKTPVLMNDLWPGVQSVPSGCCVTAPIDCQALSYDRQTNGNRVLSNRNLICAFLIRHKTLSDREVKSLSAPIASVFLVLISYDTQINGQCVVSERNLACSFLIRHKTLSDREVKSLSAPIASAFLVLLSYDSQINGQCVVSERNLACSFLIRHTHCPTVRPKSFCSHCNCVVLPTVVRQGLRVDRIL